jgi:hypothetical protein
MGVEFCTTLETWLSSLSSKCNLSRKSTLEGTVRTDPGFSRIKRFTSLPLLTNPSAGTYREEVFKDLMKSA